MQLDLNLLTALDALLEEGSVTGAADRLRLSAPAMSRTLGRIRRVTGDQILIRTGRAMAPTPYALRVQAEVHRLVHQAHAVLSPEPRLELPTLQRSFTLQFHDAVTTVLGPHLLAATRREAPGVRLRFLPEASTDTNELRHGQVDLQVSGIEPPLPDVHSETVAHDRLVVVVRADHPKPELTITEYAGSDHVIVSRRGRMRDLVDEALEAHGQRRRVIASVPTSASALRFVQAEGVLVTVPEHVGGPMAKPLGLRLAPLPLDMPPIPLILAWHRRYDGDRAHMWLRDHVRKAVRDTIGESHEGQLTP